MNLTSNNATVKRYIGEIETMLANDITPPEKRRGGNQAAWQAAVDIVKARIADDDGDDDSDDDSHVNERLNRMENESALIRRLVESINHKLDGKPNGNGKSSDDGDSKSKGKSAWQGGNKRKSSDDGDSKSKGKSAWQAKGKKTETKAKRTSDKRHGSNWEDSEIETTVEFSHAEFSDGPLLSVVRQRGSYQAKAVYISGRLAQWIVANADEFIEACADLADIQNAVDGE